VQSAEKAFIQGYINNESPIGCLQDNCKDSEADP